MAEPVMMAIDRGLGRLASLAAGLAVAVGIAAPALAQALPDPTRPPASMLTPQPAGQAGRDGAQAATPVLQSIVIAPGRRIATINGQSVRVGDRIGDARVTAIADNEVTLRGPGGRRVLKIFPDGDKRPVTGPTSGYAGARHQDK